MAGNLTIWDRILNRLIYPKTNRIKMRCKYCNQPIFNLDTLWAKTGQCIYCYQAEERGKTIIKEAD